MARTKKSERMPLCAFCSEPLMLPIERQEHRCARCLLTVGARDWTLTDDKRQMLEAEVERRHNATRAIMFDPAYRLD